MDFGEAFGVTPTYHTKFQASAQDLTGGVLPTAVVRTRRSYDEDIRLAPYTYGEPAPALSRSKTGDSSPMQEHFAYAM